MMTAEQLKASILQLAVQGKLVEQRPDEGTGKELFIEIQIEKKKLIKEGKLKKHKPLPEITEDKIPFDIPNSWEWVNLGELISVISGVSYKKGDVQKSGIRILRGGNLSNMEVTIEEDDVFLPSEYYDQQKQVQIGDILVVASTGSKTVIGKPGFVDRGLPNTMIGAFLRICRPVTLELASFLKLLFGGEYYRKHIRDLAQGTNINNVKEEYITNLIIPLPPLAEQKRIVAKIEELMPIVEQYAATSTKLNMLNTTFPEMMKKSILQEAVQGKLVPQDPNDEPASLLLKKIAEEKKRLIKEGKIKKQKPLPEIMEDEIPFDIPESWEWVRFSEIMNSISTGPFGSMLHKTDYENEGIPIVNPIHMQGRRIIPSSNSLISNKTAERLSSYKLQAGDIVLARRGDIGRSAVVHEAESGWICGTGSFFATPSKGINPDFISLMFTTPYVRQALLGESVGTTMNNLNQKILLSFLFPLPPEKEQERILGAFDNLNRVLTGLATIS